MEHENHEGLKKEKHKPSYRVSVSTESNPDLEHYDVDDDISVMMSGKVKGKHMMDDVDMDGGGKGRHIMMDMEMNKCEIMHKGEKKEKNDYGVSDKVYDKMKKTKMV